MTTVEKRKYNSFLKQTQNEDTAFTLWLKWKCLTDLYFLGTEVLGWNKTSKRGRKNRIDSKFHRWLSGLLDADEDTLILVPRDHLKTTFIKLKIIQDILNNPNVRILLCSLTKRLVVKELEDIKRWFSTKFLRELFPEIIPDPGKDFNNWAKSTEQELTLKRDPERGFVPQGPQVLAVGAGARITGFRFERAYIDDIVDDSTVTTAEQLEKTADWWGYLQPMIETKGGVTTIIGTHYHYLDLYSMIIQDKQIKRTFKRAAIENGKTIYRFFSLKEMEIRKRKMGIYKFNCQYMNNPIPIEEKFFPPPHPTYSLLPKEKYKYYISVDPAATTSKWSDRTGITIAAVNSLSWLYIVECFGVKLPGNELAELLIKKVIQYEPTRVGIELGLQEHLRHIIDLKVSDYNRVHDTVLQFPLMAIPISRTKTKAQRIASTLGAFVRERKCLIHESCTALMREMEFYTGKDSDEDNLIDSASMLFSTVENFAQHYWIEKQFRKGGMTILDLFPPKEKTWESRFVS